MKIKISSAIMATLSLALLASCTEGKYWDEPSDKGEIVAFAKPAVDIKVAAGQSAPESYTVTLSRSTDDGEQTVPVTLTTDYPDIFTGGNSVTFKAGEYTAEYTIGIGDIMPGMVYTASLGVENPEGSFIHVDPNNLSFNISLTQELVWTAAGDAEVTSLAWVENVTGTVKVEEGNWPVAGQRLFRLVDVYNTLEPDFAEKGYYIPFLVNDEGNALGLFNAWSEIGEQDEDGNALYFGCPAAYGATFTNEGNVYTMDGIIGYADGDGVTPGWYETLVFEWTMPSK